MIALPSRRFFVISTLLLSAFSAVHAQESNVPPAGFTALFNGKDLSGWYTYLGASGKNKDPKGIFRVEDVPFEYLQLKTYLPLPTTPTAGKVSIPFVRWF